MAFACVHCNKKYGSSNAKTNHQRVCGLEKALANEREENATLREELRLLREEVNRANARPTTINVFCFGSEPSLSDDVMQSILKKDTTSAVAEYVRKRHFVNPYMPAPFSNEEETLAEAATPWSVSATHTNLRSKYHFEHKCDPERWYRGKL